MLGLSFLSQVVQGRRRGDDSPQHLKERHRKMMALWHAQEKTAPTEWRLSKDQQQLLDDLQSQLSAARRRQSDKHCCQCGTQCIIVDLRDIEVDYCLACKGIWFDPGELMHVTGQRQDVPDAPSVSHDSKYKCPVCQARMTEHVFLEPGSLLVDRCPDGHGVYLEAGELERALKLS